MDSEQSGQRPKRSLHVRVYEDDSARLEFLAEGHPVAWVRLDAGQKAGLIKLLVQMPEGGAISA